MKLSEVVESIIEQCRAERKAADEAVGNDPKTGAFQTASDGAVEAIVERVCTNRDHETDAAIRADVLEVLLSETD